MMQGSAGTPQAAPAPAPGGVPAHPDGVNESTKKYAEQLVAFLRGKSGQYSMSKIGAELQRPDKALKIGRVMKTYPTWFRRSGEKGTPCRGSPLCLYR